MSSREKVEFDPLSSFNGNVSSKSNKESKEIAEDKPSFNTNESVSFKELDTTKIKFSEKKKTTTDSNDNTITGSIASSKSNKGADTFNANLWDNNNTTSASKKVNLFDISNNNEIKNEDDGIFSKSNKISSGNSIKATNISTKFRVTSEEDDNNINSLNVSKILERESDLDYNTYGVSSSSKSNKVINQSSKSNKVITNNDLDISNLDNINTLQESINQDSIEQYIKSSKSSKSNKINDYNKKNDEVDIDINKLDLNAYIEQQSKEQGGLFD